MTFRSVLDHIKLPWFQSPTNKRSGYMGQLDSLRCFAVTAVILSHSLNDITFGYFSLLDEVGMNSVYMFFVLSAYLITSQLLQTAQSQASQRSSTLRPLLNFFARRAIRLFPALYIALLGAALVRLPGMREEVGWHALHLTNVLFTLYPDVGNNSTAGHLWSLNLEEQFYVFWPLVIFFVPTKYYLAAFSTLLAVGVYAWLPENRFPEALHGLACLTCWDSLAFGALAALARSKSHDLRCYNWVAIPLIGTVIVSYAVQCNGTETSAEYAAVVGHEACNALFTLLIVNAASGYKGAFGKILDQPFLRYIGKVSYAMYIYHIFIMETIFKVLEKFGYDSYIQYNAYLFFAVYFLTLLASAMSWEFIEGPINAYRKNFHDMPPRHDRSTEAV